MTIRTALAQGSELLGREGIAEPRLTAERVLLGHAIHCDRSYFTRIPEQELRDRWNGFTTAGISTSG